MGLNDTSTHKYNSISMENETGYMITNHFIIFTFKLHNIWIYSKLAKCEQEENDLEIPSLLWLK